MALTLMEHEGQLLVLLNPEATPEKLRDDLAANLGHLIGSGILVWNTPEQGLP
ncbi:hypothetical protein [Streptomyces sp. NPDC094049]|uniref:hypothetical protein n=1 Tax=Streptomyces sp. NPDC094049 TaxID=3154987 RepID=UPI003333FA0B